MAQKEYGIAIAGVGTVGGAVALQIVKESALVESKTGVRPVLRRIIEKNVERVKELGFPASMVSTLEEAVADPAVDLVIELVGGLGFARAVIETALKAKKPVVTANKALISAAGPELFALARQNGVWVSFEASCEGAVPIIRALTDGMVANRIDALYGIVNGTCNYILTAMTKRGQSYADALREAQRDGLAEADPTLDVKGFDSAHKLSILSALAFGERFGEGSFPVKGIDALDVQDILYGKELGYVIKLLAVAERHEGGFALSVQPRFISLDHPLAWVSGAFNAVSLYGHAAGHSMYYGRGAGGLPTSAAVMADVVSSALGTAKILFDNLKVFPDRCPEVKPLAPAEAESRYYLRLLVKDEPGVLAAVSGALAAQGISISSALQKETADSDKTGIPFVITTHRTKAGRMDAARVAIEALPACVGSITLIPILDERAEF
jgi:homoserine dehydrogenase